MSYAPINHSLDFMQEIPHFFNPATGREEPITGAGPIGTYRGGAEMEPIGTYKGGAVAVPLSDDYFYEDSPDFSVPLPYEDSPDFSVPMPQTTSGEERSSLPFLENFMKENQLANLSDYRRKWLKHTSGESVITDPIYRKNLQDIILYPDRFGFGNVRV